MDVPTIVTMVAPYLWSLGEKALEKGGEKLGENASESLWKIVKKQFKSERDQSVAQDFEKSPHNPKLQGKVELKLEELLEADPEFAKEVVNFLNQIKNESSVNIDISKSKNFVINSTISAQGDFVVGDKK